MDASDIISLDKTFPPLREDLSGTRFGRLLVLGFAGRRSRPTRQGYWYYWHCQCDCGQTSVAENWALKGKRTTSCGCYHLELLRVKKIELTGRRFGRWTVIKLSRYSQTKGRKHPYWLCRCDCGTEKEVIESGLLSGANQSCRCLNRERTSASNSKHGRSRTSEHRIWCGIKKRCNCPTDHAYENYGGRGIRVCQRYSEDFAAFLQDMGSRPSNRHSINRKENDGHYSCGQCTECLSNGWTFNLEWATSKTQSQNTRRNHLLTWNGKTQCISAWAEELHLPARLIWGRIVNCGWSVEKALTSPCP